MMITVKAPAQSWMPNCSRCGKQIEGVLVEGTNPVVFEAQCHGDKAIYQHWSDTSLTFGEQETAGHAAVKAWDPFPEVTP